MLLRAVAISAIVGVLAGCGIVQDPAATSSEAEPPDAEEPMPAPQDPTGEVMNELVAYGQAHADTFGGMWIDPPGGTGVVMVFTADIEAHRVAVNEILPGTRVSQVLHTKAALDALQARLTEEPLGDAFEPISVGVDERRNVVVYELRTNDPTLELRMEAAHGGMLDVTAYPIPGPWANVASGDGWRLVATGEASAMEAYLVRAAKTAEEWNELWETLDLSAEQPEVDLAAEVVVSFAEGIGSSCRELRLDAVGIEDGVVYSVTSDPLAPRACTSDLTNAAVFVVALERPALPPDGFTLRLRREMANFSEDLVVSLP